tara:strand:+ start:511 stop:1578 length:1068 start_codon:yes stop_codon:yes gene_type:complete
MTYIIRKNNYTAIESINGKRMWFATKTPNKRLAEKRAKAYFQALREENLAAAEKLMNRNPSSITIGELMDLYEKLATVKAAHRNRRAMERILREVGVPLTKTVNSLSGRIFSDFENLRHKQANGVLELRTAKTTVASTVRQAKSIFSKKMMQRYADEGLVLDVKEFKGRSVEQGPRARFKAPKDKGLYARTLEASKKLRTDDPEAYKAYLCGYFAGMRKGEVANAKMSFFTDHAIEIVPHGDWQPKNGEERTVPIHQDIWAIFMELTEGKSEDDYLLSGCDTERLENVFRRLNAWLGEQGWNHSSKKFHELRKAYGSAVLKQGGISAAQHLLGHKDISTTDRYYTDLESDIVINS